MFGVPVFLPRTGRYPHRPQGSDEGPWNHSFRLEQHVFFFLNQGHRLCLSLQQARPASQSRCAHRPRRRPRSDRSAEEARLVRSLCLRQDTHLQDH